jgi:hypothetical protein
MPSPLCGFTSTHDSDGDAAQTQLTPALWSGAGLKTWGERQHLQRMLAGSTGLEPAASGVTGRRSNQLNYDPKGPSELQIADADFRLDGTLNLSDCRT